MVGYSERRKQDSVGKGHGQDVPNERIHPHSTEYDGTRERDPSSRERDPYERERDPYDRERDL